MKKGSRWLSLQVFQIFSLMSLCAAQEMPDTIWGFSGSDTVSLAIHKGFSGGWSVRLFYRSGSWQEVARETLSLDTMPHLLQWTQYCEPPFQKPCKRIRFTYLGDKLYYTTYRYEEPIFVPTERSYLWGLSPTKTENLLFSAVVEAFWPASADTLHPIWPFSRQWKRTHWPDSTLTEVFDSTYQVFIEVGGFSHFSGANSCDSTWLYVGAFLFPAALGEGTLCFPDGEHLALARDSVCDTSFCWIRQRELSYAGGLPTRDTLRLLQRTLTGQVVASALFGTLYQYDASNRLIEVHTSTRRYRLSYSGQILSLPPLSPPALIIQYSSSARWIEFQGLSGPATVRLYDLTGRVIYTAEVPENGLYSLPLTLEGPHLLQVSTASGALWQKVIFFP